MITIADYYMGRELVFPEELTDALRTNAIVTVDRANKLLDQFGEERNVTSGWRPLAVNQQTRGAAPRSKHLTCQAIDLADPEGDLDEWLLDWSPRLVALQLWLEHPASTKGWCHVQTVPPKSGRLVFYP